MAKLNAKTAVRRPSGSPLKTSDRKTVTHEGAAARGLDAKTELFTLAVTNKVGEDTFYESGKTRDNRFATLVAQVTKVDADWVARMLTWLRSEANMRTASIVGAAEYVRAGGVNGRQVVASVLQRADEPGEILAYWTSTYGRKIPQPIKRGVADATAKLYNEYSVQKYDSANRGFRFADVIQLTHPRPQDDVQDALFKYALDRRYQGASAVPGEALTQVRASKALAERVAAGHFPSSDELRAAGWTWERLSSEGAFDKDRWEAVIPSMGYMALLRNLRNFEQAGVREPAMRKVRDILRDPERVAKSRQLPYRFYSAYRQVDNVKTKAALEEALEHSFQNIELPGRSLVLIDVSGSMQGGWGWGRQASSIAPADIASVMGVATALGTDADIVAFGTSSKRVGFRKGGSVLEKASRIPGMGREVGHGTNIGGAIKSNYAGHDRVMVFTDMQSADSGSVNAPVYIFDLAGYGRVPDLSKRTVLFSGWSDVFLKTIPLIERGKRGDWPF